MRTPSIATAALALALFHQPASTSAQLPGQERYPAAADVPLSSAGTPEELPPTSADSASPSAPLQPLDVSGGGDGQFDRDSFRGEPQALPDAAAQSPAASQAPLSTRTPPSSATSPPRDAFTRQPTEAAQGSPATPPRTSAKDLLVEMLAPPSGAELAGVPVSLTDAMEGIYGRDRQTEVVSAYWQLTVAVAQYHVAYRARVAAESEAEWREAQLEAVRAQHKLAQALQWEHGRLPLPSSQPHSGSYKTRYEEIFAGRSSRRAWELEQTLPLLYEVMKAHAQSLAGNRTDAAFTSQAHRFLDAVREYNLAIAEYAVLATGDSLPGRDLVPLLIRVDREEEDDHVAGQRDRLGRTSSLQRGGIPATAPRRAIRDPQVVRTAGEQAAAAIRSERSILGQSPERAAAPATDQWRERNPARSP